MIEWYLIKKAVLTNDLNENTDILGDLAFQWEMIKWAYLQHLHQRHTMLMIDLAEDDYNKENYIQYCIIHIII